MHELLLFGQVPASRHTQVLNILAGLAAMQPQPVLEKHLVFKPNRKPTLGRQMQVGGAQDVQAKAQALQAQTQGDLYYLQLVAEVDERKCKEEDGEQVDTLMTESEPAVGEQNGDSIAKAPEAISIDPPTTSGSWSVQFRDLPEVARQRQVTSRLIVDTPISSGDPMNFMAALDYTHVSSYFLSGHRFTHLSISLLLYRLVIPSTLQATHLSTSVNLSEKRLLDPSGTYILQAAVRVQDGSKVETMTKGMNELLSLKETLKGCVDLEMGDRLALDTRVR